MLAPESECLSIIINQSQYLQRSRNSTTRDSRRRTFPADRSQIQQRFRKKEYLETVPTDMSVKGSLQFRTWQRERRKWECLVKLTRNCSGSQERKLYGKHPFLSSNHRYFLKASQKFTLEMIPSAVAYTQSVLQQRRFDIDLIDNITSLEDFDSVRGRHLWSRSRLGRTSLTLCFPLWILKLRFWLQKFVSFLARWTHSSVPGVCSEFVLNRQHSCTFTHANWARVAQEIFRLIVSYLNVFSSDTIWKSSLEFSKYFFPRISKRLTSMLATRLKSW